MSWALWLTGAPASGKTTLAAAVRRLLKEEGACPVVLESDVLREILTPEPSYEPQERDRFYREVADLAALLVRQDFAVLVDATAPRRTHRDRARAAIPRFVEVQVTTPAEIRAARDPKGLYRRASEGHAPHLPGATEAYEEPLNPDLVVSGTAPAEIEAERIVTLLRDRGFLPHGNDASGSRHESHFERC